LVTGGGDQEGENRPSERRKGKKPASRKKKPAERVGRRLGKGAKTERGSLYEKQSSLVPKRKGTPSSPKAYEGKEPSRRKEYGKREKRFL